MTVQVKSRNTGPWTSLDFVKVLTGEKADSAALAPSHDGSIDDAETVSGSSQPRRGPARRVRPFKILQADPSRAYVFITDAAVEKSLLRYAVDRIGDLSEAAILPGHLGRGLEPKEQASLATRVSIIEKLPRSLVEAKTTDLLRTSGHVPIVRCAACRKALIEAVRTRLLGDIAAPLSRAEITDIILRHDGSLSSCARFDRYVEPACYPTIEKALAERHVVIISGPPGTGKTTTADLLEERYRRNKTGFEVVGKEGGPDLVSAKLRAPGPVLFHLQDPWGNIRLIPSARPWSGELLKLLRGASPDKKFLITTRSDVLHEAGQDTSLKSYTIMIEPEHYDEAARGQIYDNHTTALRGRTRDMALRFRAKAIGALRTPFEIDRFFASIEKSERSEFDEHFKRSQVEAISSVVKEQVLAGVETANAVAAAAVTWGLTSAFGPILSQVVSKVRRRMTKLDPTFRVEVEAFMSLMIAARNIRQSAGLMAIAHPQVESGFRQVLTAHAAAAEAALNLLVRALIDIDRAGQGDEASWGKEASNRLRLELLGLEGIELDLPEADIAALDGDLEAAVVAEQSHFVAALDRLAVLSDERSMPGRLARIFRGKDRSRGSRIGWTLPRDAIAAALAFAADATCRTIARRMVTDILPSSSTPYLDGFVELVLAIDSAAETDFLAAIADGGIERFSSTSNLRVVVHGALAGKDPPYEAVIQAFVSAQSSIGLHHEGQAERERQAFENVLDEAYGNYVLDHADEDLSVLQKSFKELVAILRNRLGVAWLSRHPDRAAMLPHWRAVAKDRPDPPPSAEEVKLLLDLAPCPDARGDAWLAAAVSPYPSVTEILRSEMSRPGSPRALRQGHLRAFVGAHGTTWEVALGEFAGSDNFGDPRRLELAVDLSIATVDDDFRTTKALRSATGSFVTSWGPTLAALATRVLDQADVAAVPTSAGRELSELADAVLPLVAGDVGALILLSMPADELSDTLFDRYAVSAAPDEAVAGVVAIGRSHDPERNRRLQVILDHPRMRVREQVVVCLVPLVSDRDTRSGLSERLASDESATVRLRFARSMAEQPWPEARNALCRLLTDDRDFDRMHSEEGHRIHEVARAATIALSAQSELEPRHLAALQAAIETPNGDDEAALDAMRLLEKRPEPATGGLLLAMAKGGFGPAAESKSRSSWEASLPWDALMTLARRGADGFTLWDAASLDALAALATDEKSEFSIPAVLAAAAHLDAGRLRALAGVLSEEGRALLLVTVAQIRPAQTRRETADLLEPRRRIGDRLAEAVSIGRGEAGDRASIVAAFRPGPEFDTWLRAADAGPARRQILSMFEVVPSPEAEGR